ncbi:MAG: IgGFc-binding protein, partial [Saprospiraceae bacterium]
MKHPDKTNRSVGLTLFAIAACFWALPLSAQLDTIHWIPPMHSRYTPATLQVLYLSTPEITPFDVTISYRTDGGAFLNQVVSVSNANPAQLTVGATTNSALLVPNNQLNAPLNQRGIVVRGPKRFYCNLRVQQENQATSLSAKGNKGLGRAFRIGHLINEAGANRSNFVGIMATEDNTVVNISGYNPAIRFQNNGPAAANVINPGANVAVTLNAGQSYVISAYCHNAYPANYNGLIGTLISSDKPVAVNCGSWWANHPDAGQDMGVDQITPLDFVGTEYILSRGGAAFNGISRFLETPIAVAHFNGTEIYINGSATPNYTLNAGQYIAIPHTFYVNQQNMYVRSSQPLFMYQSLAGGGNSNNAELNFVPPLNCETANAIDNVPRISLIGNNNYSGSFFVIAQNGCQLDISTTGTNGTLQGPFPVLGKPDFFTLKGVGYTGNLRVISDCPIQLGILGRSNNRGWGAYFAGFKEELLPEIALRDSLPCLDTLFLTAKDANYIRWYKDGALLDPQPLDPLQLPVSDNGIYMAVGRLYEDCREDLSDTVVWEIKHRLSFNLTSIPENCACDTPGAIQVSAQSSTNATFEYSLDGLNWQSDSIFDSLSAGLYPVYVRIADGECPFVEEITIPLNASAPLELNLCKGDSILVNGVWFHADNLSGQVCIPSMNCDSILQVQLTLYEPAFVALEQKTCDPAAVGVQTLQLQTVNGCDSTVVITTTPYPNIGVVTQLEQKTCDPAAVGVQTLQLQTVNGCD